MNFTTRPIRLVARLDIKGENLIKGVNLEGLRVLGAPEKYAKKYYTQGVDEIIFMDIVASLYGRSQLVDIVKKTSESVFVPMTVGGGVRSISDVDNLLRAGADKVAVNTAAVHNPNLIRNISKKFGSQCMVLSIEAKHHSDEKWEVYTDSGREKTGIDVFDWVKEGVRLGAGEILITSIDQEGTGKGFDNLLTQKVSRLSSVPVITSGGYGKPEHLESILKSGTDAVAFADALHYGKTSIPELRKQVLSLCYNVRTL